MQVVEFHAIGAETAEALVAFAANRLGSGVLCLLARGLGGDVSRTWVEVQGFDFSDDDAWVERCFAPALRSAGTIIDSFSDLQPALDHIWKHTPA